MNCKPFSLALLALAALTAQAATVQVTVLARDGKPLADAVVVVQPAGGTKAAAQPAVQAIVNQEKMQFSPQVTVVPVGSTVSFVNLDAWEHHVRVVPADATAAISPARNLSLSRLVHSASTCHARVDANGLALS